MTTGTKDVPGGKHTASQNEDGTWDIGNVPIFAQHTRKVGDTEIEFGKDWLIKAKAKEDARVANDNYMPPLHIHHHGARETTRAGFFRSKVVAQAKYEGKLLWMTFADLIKVPADVYEKIKAGALPYRSVEIHRPDQPEINSLALLDDEVPFFRLSLLTIGKEIPAEGLEVGSVIRTMDAKSAPVLAYRALGEGSSVLMDLDEKHLRRQDMADETEEEKKKKAEEAKKKGEQFADHNGEMAQAIASIIAMLQSLMAKMSGGEEKPGGGAPAPAENLSAKDADKGAGKDYAAEIAKLPAEARGAVAALMGRVDAAEGKVGRMEQETQLDKAVFSATKKLLTYGLDQEKTTKTLFDIARKDGIPAMQSYVQAVEDHGQADPLPGVESSEAIAKLPKEMQVFANLGEGVLEKAVKYSNEFDNLTKDHGMKLEFGRQQYVADCLEAEGHKVELPKKDKED